MAAISSGRDVTTLHRLERLRLPRGSRRPRGARDVLVHALVVGHHARAAESCDRATTAALAVDPLERTSFDDEVSHLFTVLHDVSGDALLDELRYTAAAESDDRATGQHRLDEDEPERLIPFDR